MKRFSLFLKLIIVYLVANLTIFVPLNKYIYNNVDKFYTIFQKSNRLFRYDRMPDLSMKGHWINNFYEDNEQNIIMVGDSTVEDFYVEYDDSIGNILDEKLFNDKTNPQVFNFGSSGTKSVYVMERIKKAATYNPDLIIWQMGAGSFTEIDWLLPPKASSYHISLGGGLFDAYRNIPKINNENGYFISKELRDNIAPLSRYSNFYSEYLKGARAKAEGLPLVYPNDRHMKVQIGDVKITEEFHGIEFDKSSRYFGVVGEVCRYIKERDIDLMIYIAPINQSIMAEKYEEGYYEKLYEVIKSEAEPYGVPVLDIHNLVPDELFIDGGHLKEEGDALVAEGIYNFVLNNFPEICSIPG